jgi:acetolactate synthase-1/2/3 large subunit
LQSLAFSKHEGLPILIVIFNNNGYAAMRENQRDYYPDGFGAANDIWQGHPLTDFNYEELAHMFGFFGARVEKITDLPKILEQAHKSVSNGYTAILNVLLDM